MNELALTERITRSLAFMLRHQPEQFDLELDAYGWADTGEVVRALNERLGEPVHVEDLEDAVESGDRQRYEIENDRIRALYGHSIPVEPGDPSKPPETLYVAIPERDLDRAQRFGLRGGRRRFLHLALTEEDAREAGRRGARDYCVLAVSAIEAWEEGVNFYDRRSLWLAEEVPTHLIESGETYHDGTERAPRGREGRTSSRREGREGREGRGRGRGGRGRGGRGRGRDRDRDGDRDGDRDRDEAPHEAPRHEAPREDAPHETREPVAARGGGDEDRERGRVGRGGGGERGGEGGDSRPPRESRHQSAPAASGASAAPERREPSRDVVQPQAQEGSSGFGAGLVERRSGREVATAEVTRESTLR